MHLDGSMYNDKGEYTMNWIKKKLGIKSPSEEFVRMHDTETLFGAQELDQETREELFETVEASNNLQKVFGISADQAEHVIKVGKNAGQKNTMDAVDAIRHALEHTKWGVDKSDMSTVSTDQIGKHFEYVPRDNHTIIDPLIEEFTETVWDQQEKVLASGKYPHPIHRANHTALEWIGHQGQEFADAMVYRECLKQTIHDVIDLVELAQKINQEQIATPGTHLIDQTLRDALERLGKG